MCGSRFNVENNDTGFKLDAGAETNVLRVSAFKNMVLLPNVILIKTNVTLVCMLVSHGNLFKIRR